MGCMFSNIYIYSLVILRIHVSPNLCTFMLKKLMFAGSVCCFSLKKQQGASRSLNGSNGKEGKRIRVHSDNRKCSIVWTLNGFWADTSNYSINKVCELQITILSSFLFIITHDSKLQCAFSFPLHFDIQILLAFHFIHVIRGVGVLWYLQIARMRYKHSWKRWQTQS